MSLELRRINCNSPKSGESQDWGSAEEGQEGWRRGPLLKQSHRTPQVQMAVSEAGGQPERLPLTPGRGGLGAGGRHAELS